MAIKNTDIVEELALPPVKIHCSVLAEDAIKAAVGDFRVRSLMNALQGDDAAARLQAARELLTFEPAPQAAADALKAASQNGDAELAEVAGLALARILIHGELGKLESLDPNERAQGAKAMGQLDPRAFDAKSVEALKRVAENDDVVAAQTAARETLGVLEASGKLAVEAQA
jgi:hypothetical protein